MAFRLHALPPAGDGTRNEILVLDALRRKRTEYFPVIHSENLVMTPLVVGSRGSSSVLISSPIVPYSLRISPRTQKMKAISLPFVHRYDFALVRLGILGECTPYAHGDCQSCVLHDVCVEAV